MVRGAGWVVTAGVVGLIAAGCGGGSSSSGGTGGPQAKIPAFAAGFTPPATGCGSFPTPTPADPDGVIAQLDPAHQKALGGYAAFPGSTVKVLKSAWANWKPTHPGPYTVGISWGQLVSDFQVQVVSNLKKDLQANEAIGTVTLKTTGSNLDVGQQLQQYASLVQSKPDIIILETPSADSFNGPVQQAKAAGIPTVTLLSPVPVDGAVNVDGNNYIAAGTTLSYVTKLIGGKGNVVKVRALAPTAVDQQVTAAWNNVIKSCPQMKDVGEVFGAFSESQSKSQMLQYLSTHPQPIAAATALAGEGSATMQAFQQVGRTIPPLAEVGMDKGVLGYWNHNQAKGYHASSTSLPPVPGARALAEVTSRMLAGQGVKLNTIVAEGPVITDANLADWVQPSWTLTTPGTVPGAPDSFMPSSFLNDVFNNPKG